MTLLEQARNYYSCSRANDKIMPSMPELMEAFAQSVMPKWTYCVDAMPTEEGSYLCSCLGKGGQGDRSAAVWQLALVDGEWCDSDEYRDINDYWDIIAWMPLPEPAK